MRGAGVTETVRPAAYEPWHADDRFVTLLDADGRPPCDPADSCPTCILFTGQRPGEGRRAWLARIAGELRLEDAS